MAKKNTKKTSGKKSSKKALMKMKGGKEEKSEGKNC